MSGTCPSSLSSLDSVKGGAGPVSGSAVAVTTGS